MTMSAPLSREQLGSLRALASVLLPGSADSLPAGSLADLDDLLQHAAAAMGNDPSDLATATAAIPARPTRDSLSALADADPAGFDMVSLLIVGAYFMSPAVLSSLGLPTGDRRPADREQVVDELDSGILDAVFDRGCPVRTLDEVNARSAS
jgi:hypothetical protein